VTRRRAGRPSASAVPGEPVVNPHRPVDATIKKLAAEHNPLRRALAVLGPGLVTGASDDDPSGVGTYAQAGAQFGYATLWATLLMLPMMVSIQYISAKIGLVTGRGLGGVLRAKYPRTLVYPAVAALVIANTFNAGTDIGAIAAAINLLVPVPAIVFVVPVSAGILALQLLGSYELIARVFKWLALALVAFIGAALFAHPRVLDVLRGTLIPTIRPDPKYLGILVALLGTTISPYLFFWQASQEVDEQIVMGRRRLWQRQGASKRELGFALWDTVAGMVFSEIVAYFIILAAGATLFVHGEIHVLSATEAAQALRPIAGDASALLLAVGLIGAGVLAVPVLTASAAYGVAGALDWKQGLTRTVARATLLPGDCGGHPGGRGHQLPRDQPNHRARPQCRAERPSGTSALASGAARLERPHDHGRADQRTPAQRGRLGHHLDHGGRCPRAGCHVDRRVVRSRVGGAGRDAATVRRIVRRPAGDQRRHGLAALG